MTQWWVFEFNRIKKWALITIFQECIIGFRSFIYKPAWLSKGCLFIVYVNPVLGQTEWRNYISMGQNVQTHPITKVIIPSISWWIDKSYQSHNACLISHNSPFRTEMCTFLFWMVNCGIWDWCIVGFVNLGTGALWDLWIWSVVGRETGLLLHLNQLASAARKQTSFERPKETCEVSGVLVI